MKYQIETVEFPNAEVIAATAQNKDGSITLYVNALCSEEKQKKTVEDLVERLGVLA